MIKSNSEMHDQGARKKTLHSQQSFFLPVLVYMFLTQEKPDIYDFERRKKFGCKE